MQMQQLRLKLKLNFDDKVALLSYKALQTLQLTITMKKALTEILQVRTNPDKTIFMSITEKESDLGISFNKRLFLLIKNDRFGYISNFKESDNPEDVDTSKCKVLVENKRITTDAERNKNVIVINFTVVEDKKKIAKKWTLKMATEELAKQWEKIINEERQKRSTSRNQSGLRSPAHRNQDKEKQQMAVNGESKLGKVRQQLKKDFSKPKNPLPAEKQQYKNGLYQTQNKPQFILDSEQKHNQAIVSKKLEYGEQNIPRKTGQNIARKTEQNIPRKTEQQKKEEESLRRQREQLIRKQKELKEREEKIEEQKRLLQERSKENKNKQEEKKKPQQIDIKKSQQISKSDQINKNEQISKIEDKSEQMNKNKQVTVINENFFQQEKPQMTKQSHVKKPELSATRQKPKLDGVNYSQLVHKVIFSKSNQELVPELQPVVGSPSPSSIRNKKIEQVHEDLLRLEQLKFKSKQSETPEEPKKPDNLPLELGWTFRYLVKEAEGAQEQIVEQFNYFCSSMLKEVVEEFHLPERKRAYLPKSRRQEYFLYEKDDIEFKVGFIGLKEIYNKDEPSNRDHICDQRSIKILENQFKNYQLLRQASIQTRTRHFRTPLACLCQYDGFVAFFKARSQFDNQAGPLLDKKVQIDLDLISQKTKILGSVLRSKQSLLILKLNNEFYRELAAQTGNAHANFDYYFVEEIKYLMPPDLLFSRHESKQKLNQPSNQNVTQLRAEILAHYSEDKEEMGENILGMLKKTNKISKSPNAELEKLSQKILIPITKLIKELDGLMFCFVHPKQLEERMHDMGINMRYLGLIYENCTLKFVKTYIMSEMAARAARALYRKTIQDYHMKQNAEVQKNSFVHSVRIQIIDFLNWILGSSSETATIWKVLSIHSLDYFNMPLAIDQIQKGYFVRSLIFHCGVEVDWSKVSISQAFVINQFFNEDNFIEAKVKIKGYYPILKQEQKELIGRMIEEDPSVFKQLQELYNIQSKTLPLKFRHHHYFDIFRKYLSNFISPDTGIQRGYKMLNLYTNKDKSLTSCEFSLRFMELKWYLKRQRKQRYISTFSEINQMVTANYGDFHPLLSQLYEIMCIFHRNNGEFEDAITFSKSSVINMLRVCGSTHQRVGQCYYQMALCCIKGGKKQQAIISLQKAKNIFQANQRQYDVSYAHVCLKLGLLFLSEAKTQQAESIVKFALSLFNRHLGDNVKNNLEQSYEEQRVECFEILARCYQLNDLANLQQALSLDCQKEIRHIKNPTNFEKILKIVLYPILSTLKASDASTYMEIISQIPLEVSVSAYMQGYERLKERVDEDALVENLEKYTENIKSIDAFMKQNKSLEEWKGLGEVFERETVNDFISLTEELIYFLGEGFITGTIRDSL